MRIDIKPDTYIHALSAMSDVLDCRNLAPDMRGLLQAAYDDLWAALKTCPDTIGIMGEISPALIQAIDRAMQ